MNEATFILHPFAFILYLVGGAPLRSHRRRENNMAEAGAKYSTRQRREAKLGKAKHSKRYATLAKQIREDELLTPEAALEKVKSLATAKFDETVEVAINLGVDPRHG